MPLTAPTNFNHLARPYRWLEYLTFGPMLERCRFHRIPQLTHARRALVLGDGDGRFLARLLAANPALRADVIDQSSSMLRLLQGRAAAIGAAHRIRIHQANVLTFQGSTEAGAKRVCLDGKSSYDLVITHFFLDCFTTGQIHALAQNLRPHLAPGALWIVSEFAIPSGPAALPALAVVNFLYLAFRILTGLRTRTLPNHTAALAQNGFTLQHQQPFLAGLLISEQWQFACPIEEKTRSGPVIGARNQAPKQPDGANPAPTNMNPFENQFTKRRPRAGEPAGPGIDPGPVPLPTPGPEPGPSPEPNLPVEPDPEPKLPPGPRPIPAPVTWHPEPVSASPTADDSDAEPRKGTTETGKLPLTDNKSAIYN